MAEDRVNTDVAEEMQAEAAGVNEADAVQEEAAAQETPAKDAAQQDEQETDCEKQEDAPAGSDPDTEEPMDAEFVQLEEEGEPAPEKEKKNFFKKNKKDKRDSQIEELTDRVRRQMAEFDNFRKRTEKEKSAMYEVGARSVIEKILPVVDNFERGLASAGETEDPFVEGMQKIYKQLMSTLEAMDVRPIEAVGKEFNPDLHNAVMHVDDESVGEGIVVEELQKGYMYRDSVVRYSMVKVAN